jgi:hypothetical protein
MSEKEEDGWKKRALGELKSLSATVAYIWVLLSAFTLYRMMILREYHIDFEMKFGFALINAFVFAKFMWMAELLHAGRGAAGRPLAYAAIRNSGIFAVILTVCHVAEEFALRWWHSRSSVAEPNGETSIQVVATLILIFVVLIPFFLARGLVEILGVAEVRRLLLETRGTESTGPPAQPS